MTSSTAHTSYIGGIRFRSLVLPRDLKHVVPHSRWINVEAVGRISVQVPTKEPWPLHQMRDQYWHLGKRTKGVVHVRATVDARELLVDGVAESAQR